MLQHTQQEHPHSQIMQRAAPCMPVGIAMDAAHRFAAPDRAMFSSKLTIPSAMVAPQALCSSPTDTAPRIAPCAHEEVRYGAPMSYAHMASVSLQGKDSQCCYAGQSSYDSSRMRTEHFDGEWSARTSSSDHESDFSDAKTDQGLNFPSLSTPKCMRACAKRPRSQESMPSADAPVIVHQQPEQPLDDSKSESECDEEAAAILNRIQCHDIQEVDVLDVDTLIQGCLRIRLYLWAMYREKCSEAASHTLQVTESIKTEHALIEKHEEMQRWIEQDIQTSVCATTTAPQKKRAKCDEIMHENSNFVPEPASAYCNGCIVMIRKDFRVGTVVREKAGGWRVVSFDDGSTGRFRPSDLRKLRDPDGIEGCQRLLNAKNPFQDCIGYAVRIKKLEKLGATGVIVGEKAGGWRIVEHDDGSCGTYRPGDMDIFGVDSDSLNSFDNGCCFPMDADYVCTDGEQTGESEQEMDVVKSARTPAKRLKSLESGADKQVLGTLSPTNPCGHIPGPASLVGMEVRLKKNDQVGMIILEKAGGWKVIRFPDGHTHTYRPGDLYVPGMPPNFLCADSRSVGPCAHFHRGQKVYIRKHAGSGVIIEEKAGGWRVVRFEDGKTGTFRPGEIEADNGDGKEPTYTDSSQPMQPEVADPTDLAVPCDCETKHDCRSPEEPSTAACSETNTRRETIDIDSSRLPGSTEIQQLTIRAPERLRTVSMSGSESPVSVSAGSDVSRISEDRMSSFSSCEIVPKVLEVVTIKRTGQKGAVVCEKPGGWRVVEFHDHSHGTFRPGELAFYEHAYETCSRPRSVSMCTSNGGTDFSLSEAAVELLRLGTRVHVMALQGIPATIVDMTWGGAFVVMFEKGTKAKVYITEVHVRGSGAIEVHGKAAPFDQLEDPKRYRQELQQLNNSQHHPQEFVHVQPRNTAQHRECVPQHSHSNVIAASANGFAFSGVPITPHEKLARAAEPSSMPYSV